MAAPSHPSTPLARNPAPGSGPGGCAPGRRAHLPWQVLLALTALLLVGAVRSEPDPCPSGAVAVQGADPATRQEVCRAADRALSFLARLGLQPSRPIRLELVPDRLAAQGHSVFGWYDPRSQRIRVMTPASILALEVLPDFHGEPFDSGDYRAVIAHEVAHAVVDQNRRVSPLSSTVQEYLASATQVAVLPAGRRAQAVRSAGVGAWEPGDIISPLYLGMAPDRFAVKSYLHLTRHARPRALVRRLMTTRAIEVAAR